MIKLIQRASALLQIRADETAIVGLTTGLMFIGSAGGAIGSPGIEAMFYARFGVDFLPYMYIALGLSTIVISLLVTTLLARTSHEVVYVYMPLALAIFLVVSRVVVARDLQWFYPPLWLGMNIMWMLKLLTMWGLAGIVCNTQQAKRLFPLFGAGGIIGLSIGGLITQPLVGLIGSENLLIVWAVALIVVFMMSQRLIAGHAHPSDRKPNRDTREGILDNVIQGAQHVRKTPLYRWMAIAAAIFAILYFLIVFPFAQGAADQFPNEDNLAGFLGLFAGVSTGIALTLSLLAANRIYARFGFMLALLIYPVIYLLGFTTLSIVPIFPVMVGFRFMLLLWAEGVFNGANQAIYNVAPGGIRAQMRIFIQGVMNPVGVSVAGVLLLAQDLIPSRVMFIIAAVFAAGCVYAVSRARVAYGPAVLEALRAGRSAIFYAENEPFGGFQQDANAVNVAIEGVTDDDPAVRRVSAQILGNLALPRATEMLVRSLGDEDPTVRAAILQALARANATSAMLEVLESLHDDDAEVRVRAIEALATLATFSGGLIRHITPLLDDKIPVVQAIAARAVLAHGSHMAAEDTLRQMMLSEHHGARIAALKVLPVWGGKEAFEIAAKALYDTLPEVRRTAATVVVQLDATACIFPLVAALSDDDESVRESVAAALAVVGEPVLPAVLAALKRPPSEDGALLALRHLPIQLHTEVIQTFAQTKVKRALYLHGLWHAASVEEESNERALMLVDSLRDAALQSAVRALRAVSVLGNQAEVMLAIESLSSHNQEQRANALEMLDAVGARDLVRPLYPLWDTNAPVDTPDDGWRVQVLEDIDPWLRASGALATLGIDDAEVKETLQLLAENDEDLIVRQTARRALEGEFVVDTIPTLSLMERILFLRRVPLFAELSPTELKHIAGLMEETAFVDGEYIAKQGDEGDVLYLIVSGAVRVLIEHNGTEREAKSREAGEYVGEMAIINHEVRSASLVAKGDVRSLCMDREQFEDIVRTRPETSLAVMRVLSDRLRERR